MRSLITEAIRQCVLDWPRIATTLLRVDPRPKPGIGTIATDRNLRLYYDPEWIKQQSFDDIVFWIKQEILPVLLRHPDRCQAVIGKTSGPLRQYVAEKLNIASDLCVHAFMEEEYQKVSDCSETPRHHTSCKTGQPLSSGLSLEQYFYHLYDEEEVKSLEDSQTSDGSDGDGGGGESGSDSSGGGASDGPSSSSRQPPSGHGGGSGTDGEPRDWDDDFSEQKLGDDHNADNSSGAGVSDSELDDLAEDFVGGSGRSASSAERSAIASKFAKPKVSPAQLLRMAIKAGVEERRSGHDEPTYRRPSRRRPSSDFIHPSYQKHDPKITIVIDTSASMRQSDIALACGMVKTALDDMRLSSVRVVSADTQINTDMQVRNIADIKLKGRGGTNMHTVCDKILEDRKDESSLVICVTDGETPWPESRRAPLVAALTRASSSYFAEKIPSHIRTVRLYQD